MWKSSITRSFQLSDDFCSFWLRNICLFTWSPRQVQVKIRSTKRTTNKSNTVALLVRYCNWSISHNRTNGRGEQLKRGWEQCMSHAIWGSFLSLFCSFTWSYIWTHEMRCPKKMKALQFLTCIKYKWLLPLRVNACSFEIITCTMLFRSSFLVHQFSSILITIKNDVIPYPRALF